MQCMKFSTYLLTKVYCYRFGKPNGRAIDSYSGRFNTKKIMKLFSEKCFQNSTY